MIQCCVGPLAAKWSAWAGSSGRRRGRFMNVLKAASGRGRVVGQSRRRDSTARQRTSTSKRPRTTDADPRCANHGCGLWVHACAGVEHGCPSRCARKPWTGLPILHASAVNDGVGAHGHCSGGAGSLPDFVLVKLKANLSQAVGTRLQLAEIQVQRQTFCIAHDDTAACLHRTWWATTAANSDLGGGAFWP